ncbi:MULTISPECIES: cytochrome P450 [Streptomyces]|uniref:Cytochrome P450 n=1 Tax=Streptomyces doebereineriae TaxID=3075528 RepID=A0ABU2VB26_9ACTN|nr:cytochrome P450 [Streptomyces sp. DSM 41640]MDT0482745.1 cytochrome P450 [Streptomyces sp. DSM 41640]
MKLSQPVDPEQIDLESVDLTDSVLYGKGDPHSIWNAMRRRDPVRWQQVDDTLGFWSVTKFDDADLVLRDHTLFTSQRGTMLFLLGKEDPARGRQMAATDPPRHTRMRAPMQRALTNKQVEKYREAVTGEVRRLLEPALSGEQFDFAGSMMTLPMTAAGTMMGLPRADWPRLTQLTTMSIAPDDPEFAGPNGADETLKEAHRELFAYFHDILRERRNNLGDDLISLLLGMEIDGRSLETGAILSNCYSLILGANVTTPFVPTGAMAEIVGTPALDEWRADPKLLNTGVDEALRWSSPTNHFMRYALQDIELRGKKIRAGDAVVVWLGSANRDEEVFGDPFTFDIRRKPNRHMAFGSGPHYCVGHTVARMTMKILFTELFESFDDFELAGEVEHLHSNFVAGIKHMPMIAKPRAAAVRSQTELVK